MVNVGDAAPEFTLESTAGGTVSLTDALESGPAVVVMNRGYWCSYCAEQLQTFSALAYDLWRNHDTTVLAITGDPVPKLVEMRDRFELTLQLLSDSSLSVAEAYTGVEESKTYGQIPLAGTFVVDPGGVVQYAQVSENAADRTYANYARHFIKNDFTDPYPDA